MTINTNQFGNAPRIGQYLADENSTTLQGNVLIDADGREIADEAGTTALFAAMTATRKNLHQGVTNDGNIVQGIVVDQGRTGFYIEPTSGDIKKIDFQSQQVSQAYNGSATYLYSICASDDGQNIYALGLAASTRQIRVNYSNDGGATWQQTANIRTTENQTFFVPNTNNDSQIGTIQCNAAGTSIVIILYPFQAAGHDLYAYKNDASAVGAWTELTNISSQPFGSGSNSGGNINRWYISRDLTDIVGAMQSDNADCVLVSVAEAAFVSRGDNLRIDTDIPNITATTQIAASYVDCQNIVAYQMDSPTSIFSFYLSTDQGVTYTAQAIVFPIDDPEVSSLQIGRCVFSPYDPNCIYVIAIPGGPHDELPRYVYEVDFTKGIAMMIAKFTRGFLTTAITSQLTWPNIQPDGANGFNLTMSTNDPDNQYALYVKSGKFLADLGAPYKVVADIP